MFQSLAVSILIDAQVVPSLANGDFGLVTEFFWPVISGNHFAEKAF